MVGRLVLLVGLLVGACRSKPALPAEPALFTQLDSAATGISFVNQLRDDDKLSITDYLYYYNGGGVATGDVNNDGLTDVFLVGNRAKNRLYLNAGNFKFKDVTEEAGVGGFADWRTGVTMADVNGDGLLDIYVCAVGNFKGLEGGNELYINRGAVGQDITFTEQAAAYGLDFTGFATQAAFFDYDHDGDLDVYLLNHAVHTSRSYGLVSTRALRNNEAGDYLLRNDLDARVPATQRNAAQRKPTKFTDVSATAGIYGAAMGYGLGITVADLNNDGWEDIYVTNDFHEDDYYYVNNRNGTFSESIKDHFRHLSRFSMGCDVADVNNDGFPDVITTDMYPEDEAVEKASAGEDPFDIFMFKLQFGFYNQYSRNCLQISLSGEKFSDVASMAGVGATDWSWSPLLADFDNDGLKDLFVSNGIVRRPNDLDYTRFVSTDSLKHAPQVSGALDKKAIALMPDGKVHNYLFRGTSSLRFEDKSLAWGFGEPTYSNGAAYADLDNDGDLDLVVNNLNAPAGLFRNEQDKLFKNNYLKIKLVGQGANTLGLGAKVVLKSGGQLQLQQQMPTRGFLSSVEPVLTFGLGKAARVDSVIVLWPNHTMQVMTNVKANATLTLRQSEATLDATGFSFVARPATLYADVTAQTALPYHHEENDNYRDFYRESLMPFQVSTEGPRLAVGDVNGDGLDDLYAGGAKWKAGQLLLQNARGGFVATNQATFAADSIYEDVAATFLDADADGDQDLYVVTGGNEFYGNMPQLFDRLYVNDGRGNFARCTDCLPPMYDNKSCAKPADMDGDGDLDLFVGGRVVGYAYGTAPRSYLLVNDGRGHFTDQTDQLAPGLRNAGMVTDAAWADVDNDRDPDLILTGDWMAPQLFINQKGKLTRAERPFANPDKTDVPTNGFWQTVAAADLDQDGDVDFLLGNLGTNTKFRRDGQSVLRMYVKDIDHNGALEQILTYNAGDKEYPVATKDELGKQLPAIINKRFTTYKSFAGKTIQEIFTKAELDSAKLLTVSKFESVWLENAGGGAFKMHDLPMMAQVSKVFAFHVTDANHDGLPDVLLGGNFYGVSTYQGRYDASYGLLLLGTGRGNFRPVLPTDCGFVLNGEVRAIRPVRTATGPRLVVARNNAPMQVFAPLPTAAVPSVAARR